MAKRKHATRVEPIVETDGESTTIKTGIYQRTIRDVELKTPVTVTVGGQTYDAWLYQTPDQLRAQAEAWNAEPQRTLRQIREQAIGFYKPYAIEVEDMNNPPLFAAMQRHDMGDGLRTYQLPDNAPPIARDAGEVLDELDKVATNKNPGHQLLAAFRLGRKYERMLVRQLEHRALAGMKQAKRNAEIAKSRELPAAELRRRHQAVQEELAKQACRGQRPNRKAAYQAASKRLRLSEIAVKKAFLAIDRG